MCGVNCTCATVDMIYAGSMLFGIGVFVGYAVCKFLNFKKA